MSNSEWAKNREEEERDEEDEVDETDYKAQKDAVLFAIDVSSSMLEKPPASDSKKADKDSATAAALKCAYQIMQQRIISNPRDMMGILLFGTEQSKFQEDTNSRGSLTYPHCYLLTDLDIPAAEDVKALKRIVEEDENVNNLLVPTTDDRPSMANVLFCANQIFTTKAPNFGSRRLFIVTDDDDPHGNDKVARSSAQVRAKDLYDLGVVIELFPISKHDHDFDRSTFYNDLIYNDVADPEATTEALSVLKLSDGTDKSGISLLSSLISNVNSKQVAKRALFSNLPFEIGPNFKISVKGYNILQREKPARNCYVWLDGEKAQIVTSETTKSADDDGARTVQKAELKKAYKFGGEQVMFSVEEQLQLRDYGPPVLRIIGFKSQSQLPSWASVNKSTFIYPSEEDYVGSTRVFTSLWQKLLKDKKMGIAWFVARKNAKPQIVALLPSSETLNEARQQTVPAGLWIYPLPFADDLRSPPETPRPIVSPDTLVNAMRKVVQQLQLPGAKYEPFKYPNPSLQWHYRILQAMALEEEIPEFKPGDDKTVPKYRQIDKHAGSYVVDWGVILEEQYRALVQNRGGAGMKREKYEDSDGHEAPKKKRAPGVKTENGPSTLSTMSTTDLKKMAKSDKTAKHTVADLKEFCVEKGLSITGKKADLVERIEAYVVRL